MLRHEYHALCRLYPILSFLLLSFLRIHRVTRVGETNSAYVLTAPAFRQLVFNDAMNQA
jgi:hypothetical protein